MSESGLPGFEYATWYGLFAPSATPRPVIAQLHGAAESVLGEPGTRSRLEAQGLEVHAFPTQRFTRYLDNELDRWQSVIAATRITAN
jgi:tripartite-type tricarboxylate transporter receptor subunit TctC